MFLKYFGCSENKLKIAQQYVLQVSNDPELSHEEREQLIGMLSNEMTSSQVRLAQALTPSRPEPDGKPTLATSPRPPQQDASVLLEQYSNMLVNMIQSKMTQ